MRTTASRLVPQPPQNADFTFLSHVGHMSFGIRGLKYEVGPVSGVVRNAGRRLPSVSEAEPQLHVDCAILRSAGG